MRFHISHPSRGILSHFPAQDLAITYKSSLSLSSIRDITDASAQDTTDEKNHSSALDHRRSFSFHIDYEIMTAANVGDLKWFDWIPFLNWINDVFFDTIVAPEQIREVVNIISLVSALLLTVAAAVPAPLTTTNICKHSRDLQTPQHMAFSL